MATWESHSSPFLATAKMLAEVHPVILPCFFLFHLINDISAFVESIAACAYIHSSLQLLCPLRNKQSHCPVFKRTSLPKPFHSFVSNHFQHWQERHLTSLKQPGVERFSNIGGKMIVSTSLKKQVSPVSRMSIGFQPWESVWVNHIHISYNFIEGCLFGRSCCLPKEDA